MASPVSPPTHPPRAVGVDDPSRAARAELVAQAADSVAMIGQLARLVSKASSSPALQSTLAAFTEYEATMQSTSEMLHKINEGMLSLDEAIEDCSRALAPGKGATMEAEDALPATNAAEEDTERGQAGDLPQDGRPIEESVT